MKKHPWEAALIGDFLSRNKKDIKMLAASTLLIVCAYLFVKVLFGYIAPFVAGWLLALIFEPLVSRLESRFRMRRGLLAALSVALVLCMLALFGTLLVTRIVSEASALAQTLPQQTATLSQSIEDLKTNYLTITDRIPLELRTAADNLAASFADSFTLASGEFVRRMSGSVVKVVPGTVIGVLLCFISMYFFIKDHTQIADAIRAKSTPEVREKSSAVKRGLLGALTGYLRAQVILMSITAVLCITGLALIGNPYALVIGLVVAVFDFLPVFGPGFVLWPWALLCAISGDFRMSVSLLVIYTVITVIRQIAEPKVVGDKLGMHPLIMLMSMFIGLRLFGVAGFLIGPMIVIALKAINENEEEEYND